MPYKNDGGAHRKFSKNTLKDTRISFDGRGSNIFFTPKRYQFKQLETYSFILFRLNTHKGTSIILLVVILDFSTLSGANLPMFLPLKS